MELSRIIPQALLDAPHEGKTFGEHLEGTATELKKLGAPDYVVMAGRLHAIYGTASFQTPRQFRLDRQVIAKTIGVFAEHLAHTFCIVDRRFLFTQEMQLHRLSGKPIALSGAALSAIRMIEIANSMDAVYPVTHAQYMWLTTWRLQHAQTSTSSPPE